MTKSKTKTQLHSRNKHREQYDFEQLIKSLPELDQFVALNKFGNKSVDFFNPEAVKALNKALLKLHYNINNWDIPANYLCPPIPGRADYIHYAADLLADGRDNIPKGAKIKCLDVGVGASCVYPIIGNAEYGWSFYASDIDKTALNSAKNIVNYNPSLKGKVLLRHQLNSKQILRGVIKDKEQIDLVICNPPFHNSAKEANAAASKKISNLQRKKVSNPTLNFGGQANELWCDGGEYSFVRKMIAESKSYAKQVKWFTALISKKDNLKHMYKALKEVGTTSVKTIEMSQGNKSSRIICWTFK